MQIPESLSSSQTWCIRSCVCMFLITNEANSFSISTLGVYILSSCEEISCLNITIPSNYLFSFIKFKKNKIYFSIHLPIHPFIHPYILIHSRIRTCIHLSICSCIRNILNYLSLILIIVVYSSWGLKRFKTFSFWIGWSLIISIHYLYKNNSVTFL